MKIKNKSLKKTNLEKVEGKRERERENEQNKVTNQGGKKKKTKEKITKDKIK